jgi:hypothetical protein
MAKKKGKAAGTGRGRKRAAEQAPPSVAAQLPQSTPAQIKAAKEKFEQGILARGEAVPAGQSLPPGATHEIVQPTDGGPPVLKRKRFSLR